MLSIQSFWSDLFQKSLQISAYDLFLEVHGDLGQVRYFGKGNQLLRQPTGVHLLRGMVNRFVRNEGRQEKRPHEASEGYSEWGLPDQMLRLRWSYLPAHEGFSLSFRIHPDSQALSLDDLGMPLTVRHAVKEYLARHSSLLLVGGKTGSGKTTTLYALLREVIHLGKRVLTLEDPVEKRVDQVLQVAQPFDGNGAQLMKAFLRHDPDVIGLGEVRDASAMESLLKAVSSGHLAVATLHAHSAEAIPERLRFWLPEGSMLPHREVALIFQDWPAHQEKPAYSFSTLGDFDKMSKIC